jgi:hypothetical protein
VTKVDFLVELNGNVTEILRAFHGNVKKSLSGFGGRPDRPHYAISAPAERK